MRFFICVLSCLSFFAQAQFISNNGIHLTNTSVLYTNGEWQNSGTIRNNGTIITSESWLNTGTMDIASTGGFILQYSSNKNFSAGSNSTRFGFLQKESAGNATISGKVLVRDSLKILSGLIKMNSGCRHACFCFNGRSVCG